MYRPLEETPDVPVFRGGTGFIGLQRRRWMYRPPEETLGVPASRGDRRLYAVRTSRESLGTRYHGIDACAPPPRVVDTPNYSPAITNPAVYGRR